MFDKENEQETDDLTHYRFEYSLDDDRFFRRSCSSCGLHFKTEADAYDLTDLLAPTFRQIEEKYDIILISNRENSGEDTDPEYLGCPYCGNVDESQNMLTDELSRYVVRWAEREIVFPAIRDFQNSLDQMFNKRSGSRGKGLVSIEFRFEHDDVIIPVRPISGPELPDMVRVDLVYCNESVKILEGWADVIFCPFCREKLVLV